MQPVQNLLSLSENNQDCIINIFKKTDIRDLYAVSLVCKLFNQYVTQLGELPVIKKSPLPEALELIEVSMLLQNGYLYINEMMLNFNEKDCSRYMKIFTIEELEVALEVTLKVKKIALDNYEQNKIQKYAAIRSSYEQTPTYLSFKQKVQILFK